MSQSLPYQPERNYHLNNVYGCPLDTEWVSTMDKINNLDYVEFLKSKEVIDEREAESLVNMITSSDRENYEMAKIILTEKTKKL